jgi:hypothetical protein
MCGDETIYSSALRSGLFAESSELTHSTLNHLTACYFNYFEDRKFGGEYYQIDADTGALVNTQKGACWRRGIKPNMGQVPLYGSWISEGCYGF